MPRTSADFVSMLIECFIGPVVPGSAVEHDIQKIINRNECHSSQVEKEEFSWKKNSFTHTHTSSRAPQSYRKLSTVCQVQFSVCSTGKHQQQQQLKFSRLRSITQAHEFPCTSHRCRSRLGPGICENDICALNFGFNAVWEALKQTEKRLIIIIQLNVSSLLCYTD